MAIVGELHDPATKRMLDPVRSGYYPGVVVAAGRPGAHVLPLLRHKQSLQGLPTAYVCEKRSCRLPTTDPATVLRELDSIRPTD